MYTIGKKTKKNSTVRISQLPRRGQAYIYMEKAQNNSKEKKKKEKEKSGRDLRLLTIPSIGSTLLSKHIRYES